MNERRLTVTWFTFVYRSTRNTQPVTTSGGVPGRWVKTEGTIVVGLK